MTTTPPRTPQSKLEAALEAEWLVHSDGPEATRALGEKLGRLAQAGTIVLLSGELGAGKTVLAQGVAAGLGVPTVVNSPTFVLVNEYEGGRLPLAHADLYRLSSPEEIEELALDEIAEASLLLVEWPERWGAATPSEHLTIEIAPGDGEQQRRLRLYASGAEAAALLAALRDGG